MEKIGCKKTGSNEDVQYLAKNVFESDNVCLSCRWFDVCREAKEEENA